MKKGCLLFLTLLCGLLCSCSQGGSVSLWADRDGDTLKMKYAEHITMIRYAAGTKVVMLNPWKQGKVLHTYYLVPRGSECPHPADGDVVQVPLERSVVFNTAHAWLVDTWGATDRIRGVADIRFMQLPEIHRRVKEGMIADCGEAMAPNMERIIDISTDAILLSPFENSGGYGPLENLGVPLIECADYMETSALGRAEWMRFYGMLYGREREADSLFHVVDSSYHALSVQARKCGGVKEQRSEKTKVITEKLTGSTWYVPGGCSSVGRLIADANGNYAWASDKHSGSLALSFETVFDKAGDADVWLFNDYAEQPMTYNRLAAEYRGYPMMKAFRQHRVWYVNSLRVPYFEEVSFRPDWLLRDYICMLYPDSGLGVPKYFRKVERSGR